MSDKFIVSLSQVSHDATAMSANLEYLTRVNRRMLTISTLEQSDFEDTLYWLSKPPIERLMALEILRRQMYGHGSAAPRLQRFLEIIEPA